MNLLNKDFSVISSINIKYNIKLLYHALILNLVISEFNELSLLIKCRIKFILENAIFPREVNNGTYIIISTVKSTLLYWNHQYKFDV